MLEFDKIYNMDCIEGMKQIYDNSIDAIVTDPPYSLGFMGKDWDTFKPQGAFENKKGFKQLHRNNMKDTFGFQQFTLQWSQQALRVLKPGGHMLSFGGSRTYHRMACGVEDAGFEIRDQIMWVYGSGFPKSLNVGKAIDKVNGETNMELKFVEWMRTTGLKQKEINIIIDKADVGSHYLRRDQPAIPTKELWEKLKPYIKIEIPIWIDELVERIEAEREIIGDKISPDGKPYSDRQPTAWTPQFSDYKIENAKDPKITAPATPEAKQWEGWGTALKPANEPIVLARKPLSEKNVAQNVLKWGTGGINIDDCRVGTETIKIGGQGEDNMFHGNFSGNITNPIRQGRFPANLIHDGSDEVKDKIPNGNARFFYCAKASKSERNEGLDDFKKKRIEGRDPGQDERNVPYKQRTTPVRNQHPTVKPIALMRYLIRLITPPDGVVLDPFIGSGTTAIAAYKEHKHYIGFEKEKEYFNIAEARIKHYTDQKKLKI